MCKVSKSSLIYYMDIIRVPSQDVKIYNTLKWEPCLNARVKYLTGIKTLNTGGGC